jgi:hypothetical protein
MFKDNFESFVLFRLELREREWSKYFSFPSALILFYAHKKFEENLKYIIATVRLSIVANVKKEQNIGWQTRFESKWIHRNKVIKTFKNKNVFNF